MPLCMLLLIQTVSALAYAFDNAAAIVHLLIHYHLWTRLLEAIFSYIFGDGDPDNNIEQRRIEAAARVRERDPIGNGNVTT